jgi:hypothetical protein
MKKKSKIYRPEVEASQTIDKLKIALALKVSAWSRTGRSVK